MEPYAEIRATQQAIVFSIQQNRPLWRVRSLEVSMSIALIRQE